ncbi:E3 ubiquitin-protein ligase RNF212B [Phyllobates terribilis]|uniref:E3 ubiquitin-protein ligase RNF212B n=1 Tax=Phyllobates terribilis TaxID=111132 RepID=UPI003CCB703E
MTPEFKYIFVNLVIRLMQRMQNCVQISANFRQYLKNAEALKFSQEIKKLKPLEKIYFKSCKESLQKGLHSISQAWRFQKQQHELHLTFYKQCLNKAQDAFQVALQKIETQQSELKTIKKENDELRSMVTQLKSSISRSQSSSRSTTPRPVAITPPSQTGRDLAKFTSQHSFHQYGQMNGLSHSSSAESPYVRTQSGTGSQSATSSRVQERTTPMSSSSSLSGHSLSSRDRTPTSSNPLHTPNESSNIRRTNSVFARDPLYTPCNSIDRLRAIQGDKWKTAFNIRDGHYEYRIMPFGLYNVPAMFQEFVNDIVQDLLYVSVVVYFDNILIFSLDLSTHSVYGRTICLPSRFCLSQLKCIYNKNHRPLHSLYVGKLAELTVYKIFSFSTAYAGGNCLQNMK